MEGHELETILREIERAASPYVQLYYLAITASLTLPEICAALESPTGHNPQPKQAYVTWYNANLASVYPNITDDDCYSLRCGLLHQGRFGRPGMQYDRIIFTLVGTRTLFSGHNTIARWPDASYLLLDAEMFCRDFVGAARKWFGAKRNDPVVQSKVPRLVQFYAAGFPRVPLPVIA
jgi:hypothetical protein